MFGYFLLGMGVGALLKQLHFFGWVGGLLAALIGVVFDLFERIYFKALMFLDRIDDWLRAGWRRLVAHKWFVWLVKLLGFCAFVSSLLVLMAGLTRFWD